MSSFYGVSAVGAWSANTKCLVFQLSEVLGKVLQDWLLRVQKAA